MMNLLTMLPGMNRMMAEDVNMPGLRSIRSHEKTKAASRQEESAGLWDEQFEHMFRGR